MLTYKTLMLDTENNRCTIDNKEVYLTKSEYALLVFLLSIPNIAHKQTEILATVFQNSENSIQSIDVLIYRLRKKLGKYSSNIVTRFGFGYTFSTEI